MVIAGLTPTETSLTSSTPPLMLPCPSAVKLPTRASGLTVVPANTSPLVTKAYWPLRLALLYLPTGGGGLTIPLPLLHAELQRAATTEKAARRRFIAHLAALPFLLATSGMPEWSKSLWYRSEEHTSELQSQSNLVC